MKKSYKYIPKTYSSEICEENRKKDAKTNSSDRQQLRQKPMKCLVRLEIDFLFNPVRRDCITNKTKQMGCQKIRKTEGECRQSDRQNWTARLSVCLSDSIFDVWRKRGFRRILHCMLMAQLCYCQLAPHHRVQTCWRLPTHTHTCTHTRTCTCTCTCSHTYSKSNVTSTKLLLLPSGCSTTVVAETVSIFKHRETHTCVYA